MRKHLILAVMPLLAVAACSPADTQTNLRKAAYDTMSAYHLSATGAQAYLASGTADPTIKAEIKTASAAAMAPLTALETSIESQSDLTTTGISTAASALAALQSALAAAQAPATTTTKTGN
ncbi:hypothetical protein AA12717_0290 [Gluconacetobacter sacchari DSM 12717]|uniref:Lipoprotein n=2 Tax=Gluconacetobacter sacchari TaxID=92759 RepID=A0A7W4NQQ9_9PROT|nr:hypothetical protein [Gluconacetobacter sacchari]MBB2159375.1 hypothetical protein [Gluconacetobacter sacchari]GBQ19552.1 hypothetical protein AA12717_0290 [Gluconacetobacter sacchari DSM 12717]